VVEGKNSFGCADYDTVVVTVIQPLRMTTSPNDSICIGQSTNLLVSGAASYNWSPSTGLNSTTISNPTAAPTVTTRYRVVGYDGFNCFTDTAFITVAIGQYPTISLGPDQTLATGTLLPLSSVITNGPIRNWTWSPTTNLSCATCPLPVADVKKDITYTVKVTTPYGCSASDTISIKTFCKDGQVFIPNAFTPDGDGVNDRLIVRASGIATVKHFRIFNRWGDLIFERDNFKPNDITYSWDGRVRGVVSGPEVFVYTCEVICENGTSYTYKGNVSIIK
jgi:gliding motility-associated-like protein